MSAHCDPDADGDAQDDGGDDVAARKNISVTPMSDMPDIKEMSVMPVAWATIRPARASQTVPTAAMSSCRPDPRPRSARTAAPEQNQERDPDSDTEHRGRSSSSRPPSLVFDRLLMALFEAGKLATTLNNAPPISTPMPSGRSICP